MLTKAQKRELKHQYLINMYCKPSRENRNLSDNTHFMIKAEEKFPDPLQRARYILTWALRGHPYDKKEDGKRKSPLDTYLANETSKSRNPWFYKDERERMLGEMSSRRFHTKCQNIAKRYDPRHLRDPDQHRFFSFPEEIKYEGQNVDLERIVRLKGLIPKARVVLVNQV